MSNIRSEKHATWCAGTPRPEKGEGVVYNCNCADYRATVRAIDDSQAEVTALRTRVAELETKVERQKISLAAHMKKTPIQAALEEAVPALETENAALRIRVTELESSVTRGVEHIDKLVADRDEWNTRAVSAESGVEQLRGVLESVLKWEGAARATDAVGQGIWKEVTDEARVALATPIATWFAERDHKLAMRVAEAMYRKMAHDFYIGHNDSKDIDIIVAEALKNKP